MFRLGRAELDARTAARFYFAPRAFVPAYIVDFRSNSAERYVKPLNDLDQRTVALGDFHI